jgi:hypothetical protein
MGKQTQTSLLPASWTNIPFYLPHCGLSAFTAFLRGTHSEGQNKEIQQIWHGSFSVLTPFFAPLPQRDEAKPWLLLIPNLQGS